VIDLHCHLLPGIDDGPKTLDGSLAMARAAAAAGTHTMVATPHIDGRYGVVPADVPAMVEQLRANLAEAHVELAVLPGGEIELSRLSELTAEELDAVRIGGGPWLLLEAPLSASAGDFHLFVDRLRRRGQRIMLAHPERSPLFQRRPERLAELVGEGVLCSLTSSALLGRFGRGVRAFALRLLADGLVHNVASDSHDAVQRGPELLAGLHAAERELPGLLDQADWLTRAMPEAVIAGAPLPERPGGLRRRRGLRRLMAR
jgi:protein-tyrosine phosphatase